MCGAYDNANWWAYMNGLLSAHNYNSNSVPVQVRVHSNSVTAMFSDFHAEWLSPSLTMKDDGPNDWVPNY